MSEDSKRYRLELDDGNTYCWTGGLDERDNHTYWRVDQETDQPIRNPTFTLTEFEGKAIAVARLRRVRGIEDLRAAYEGRPPQREGHELPPDRETQQGRSRSLGR
jgi:hypothetical protein